MNHPDSKVHGANMGPIWGRQDPGGPHVGPMNLVIWVDQYHACWRHITRQIARPWFNIKMHCGDKMTVRSSYLHNRISYTGKMTSLYWKSLQDSWWLCMISTFFYTPLSFLSKHAQNISVQRVGIMYSSLHTFVICQGALMDEMSLIIWMYEKCMVVMDVRVCRDRLYGY